MIDGISRTAVSGPMMTRETRMTARAQELEAAFLSEVLGYAGLFSAESEFGGGAAEAQFSSFLRDEYARHIVARGGLGLTGAFVEAMMRGAADGA